MERDIRIKLDRTHALYGRLHGSLSRPLVMIVHGLPGDMREGLHEHAARWFAARGFAAFRFNLYGYEKDARQLKVCTLKTHAKDLDAVVRYFQKKGVKKIYAAGHSYGGPSILLSRAQDWDAVALWDPSYKLSFTRQGGKYVRALNGYFMRWGVGVVIGKRMANEADRLAWPDLTKTFYAPLKIIVAGNGVLRKGAARYFKIAPGPKELTVMNGATHYFDDREGMQEKLFRLSKRWFRRF